MSRLLDIEEPAAATPRPSMTAFLALGFRPLYLAGASWALISIALWIFVPQVLDGPLSQVYWHAHEMLWGFIITIAVGFLLTASATWTGFNPLTGRPLGLLCLLWLAARIGFLAGGLTGFWIATAAELLFFLAAAASLMRVMVKGRSRRNYGLPVLMLALGAADLLYLLAALRGDYVVLMQRFDLGLIGMAVVALLIARRVIPFFSMRMVQGLQIPMLTRSGHVQMVFSALALVAGVLMQIVPPAAGGPAFLLLPNFRVIKRYNNADAYALAVGHLGEDLVERNRRRHGLATFRSQRCSSYPTQEPIRAEASFKNALQRAVRQTGR